MKLHGYELVNIDTQLHLQTELSVPACGIYGLTGTLGGRTVPYININVSVKHVIQNSTTTLAFYFMYYLVHYRKYCRKQM